jgi:hypothetical protein
MTINNMKIAVIFVHVLMLQVLLHRGQALTEAELMALGKI